MKTTKPLLPMIWDVSAFKSPLENTTYRWKSLTMNLNLTVDSQPRDQKISLKTVMRRLSFWTRPKLLLSGELSGGHAKETNLLDLVLMGWKRIPLHPVTSPTLRSIILVQLLWRLVTDRQGPRPSLLSFKPPLAPTTKPENTVLTFCHCVTKWAERTCTYPINPW